MNMLLQYLNNLVTCSGRLFSVHDKPVYSVVPAQLMATIMITAIMGMQLPDQEESYEEHELKYQKATADIVAFNRNLARQQQIQNLNRQSPATGIAQQKVSEEDRTTLLELQKVQRQHLDKLISLKPEEEKYRFELAKLIAASGDRVQALSILNELAPLDAPGYTPARLILANHYFEQNANGGTAGDLEIALTHVNHVLTHNEEDLSAQLMQAKIFAKLQRNEEAYTVYEDLLEVNPNYYRQMAGLNRLMQREDRNQLLYEKALASFQVLADKEENQTDDRRWIVIETGIASTLQQLERFEDAEARHEEMIEVYASDSKGGPRRVFLQRLLASTYITWAGKVAASTAPFDSLPPATQKKLLDLNTKAFRNHPQNEVAMQSLARLGFSSNLEIAAEAKTVYNPIADTQAPASVLNQLGNHALLNKKFAESTQFYERARTRSPRDPAILNNLSYSYLVAPDDARNPERALQLINEAIQVLPENLSPAEKSKFLHTKATALKQMDRIQDAIEIYELTVETRPNHADTLRSLIECYRALNKNPPEEYLSRLEKIDNQK